MNLNFIFTSESVHKESANNIAFYAAKDVFLKKHPDLSIVPYLQKALDGYLLCYELKSDNSDVLQEFQAILLCYNYIPLLVRPEFSHKTDSEIADFLRIEIITPQ